jgi:hypothetical protein
VHFPGPRQITGSWHEPKAIHPVNPQAGCSLENEKDLIETTVEMVHRGFERPEAQHTGVHTVSPVQVSRAIAPVRDAANVVK